MGVGMVVVVGGPVPIKMIMLVVVVVEVSVLFPSLLVLYDDIPLVSTFSLTIQQYW